MEPLPCTHCPFSCPGSQAGPLPERCSVEKEEEGQMAAGRGRGNQKEYARYTMPYTNFFVRLKAC